MFESLNRSDTVFVLPLILTLTLIVSILQLATHQLAAARMLLYGDSNEQSRAFTLLQVCYHTICPTSQA